MNIQNKIIEIVNSHDYEKKVEELVSKYGNNPIDEGNTISLQPTIDSEFVGEEEEEIAQKVAEQIIRYRVKEKVFMKLMSKGIIHPVRLGDGEFKKNVVYKIKSKRVSSTQNTIVYFPISVFTLFMKV